MKCIDRVLLLLLVCGTAEAVDMPVSIIPRTAVTATKTNVTIMCKAVRPLIGCNFKIWHKGMADNKNTDHPLIDFSLGINSTQNVGSDIRSYVNVNQYRGEYSGRGLEYKECGMQLTVLDYGRYYVGCRVRAGDGGWSYDFMTLVAHLNVAQPNIYNQENKIVLSHIGGNVTTRSDPAPNNAKYVWCAFFLAKGGTVITTAKEVSKTSMNSNHTAVLTDKSCNVTLINVTEEVNGPLWSSVELKNITNNKTYKQDALKVIIIAKAPNTANVSLQVDESKRSQMGELNSTSPVTTKENNTLSLEGDNSTALVEMTESNTWYAVGEVLTATCSVSASRPVANISWFLGGEVIRNDTDDDDTDRAWSWPWEEKPTQQTISRKLRSEDNGKVLSCRVQHLALKEDVEKNVTIFVQGAEENSLSTIIVIGVSCSILALTVAAVVIYAKVSRKWCFKPKGQPKARGFERDAAGISTRAQAENEGTVVYAELSASALNTRGRTNIPMTQDTTTYAELSFN